MVKRRNRKSDTETQKVAPIKRANFLVRMLLTALFAGGVWLMAVSNHPIAHVIESGPVRHALAFAALPLMTALIWPRIPFLAHVIFYAVFGAAIEIAQWKMHAGRTGEFEDWLVDIVVAVAVLAAVEQVRVHLARRDRGAPIDG